MRKTFLLLFVSLLSLGSCATLQEQFAEAVKKGDYEKAQVLAESAKNPEQARFFVEIAEDNPKLDTQKRADLLVRANTEESRKALAKLGVQEVYKKRYEVGEKLFRLAGYDQGRIDAEVGTCASRMAENDLSTLNKSIEDKDLLSKESAAENERLRKSFEEVRTVALDRLLRAGDQDKYLEAVVKLFGKDLLAAEAEKIIAKSKIDDAKKRGLLAASCLNSAEAARARAGAYDSEMRQNAKRNEPLKAEKSKAGIVRLLASSTGFARKAFETAVSLGDAKTIEKASEAVINSALDDRLGDKADFESARYVYAYHKKAATKASKEWTDLIPIAMALSGAYDAAEALFKEDGVPASEYGLTLSRVAEKRKDVSTVAAKYLILSGDRVKMEKEGKEWISDAKRAYDSLYKLSGEAYQKKKASLLIDADAAAAIAAALKNSDLYDRCIDLAFTAYDQYDRMEAYAKAFGIDERTMCSRFAAMCEKYTRFVKAAEYYGRIGDRVSLLRVAETIHKDAKDSYTKQVSQMNLYLALMEANFKAGFSVQEYKKKFESARNGFIVARSYWIKDLKVSCSLLWSLKEKQKAFDALEFLAQLGGKEEVKEFQAKWLIEEKVFLEILKRAEEKASAASKTNSAP